MFWMSRIVTEYAGDAAAESSGLRAANPTRYSRPAQREGSSRMIDGWNLLRDFIGKLATEGHANAIYRGQARYEWDTIPSGFREAFKGLHCEHRLNDWKWRAARFASPAPQDDVEWLIMAQHYGLDTPLLDWTTSPLIALYFACSGANHTDHDGCVWISAIGHFEVAHDTLLINPFDDIRDKPLVINAVGKNIRSTAQDSILTLHCRSDALSFQRDRLFTVPAGLKPTVLDQLEKLGITGERLLYDIGHLVKRMQKEYEGRRLLLHKDEQ